MKSKYKTPRAYLWLLGTLLLVNLLHAHCPPAGLNYARMLRKLATQQASYVEAAWLHGVDLSFFQDLLAQASFFDIRDGSLLLDTSFQEALERSIPTTDSKWIFSNVVYSGLFSQPEKTLLLFESAPEEKLGQIAFLYDRHAALFNYLSNNEKLEGSSMIAFDKHQRKLQNLFHELNFYYRENKPEIFSTSLFDAGKIQQMALEFFQSNVTVFSEREMAEFSQLADASFQLEWAQQRLQAVYEDLGQMQNRGKTNFGSVQFKRYYIQKMRYDHLQRLIYSLKRFPYKRNSLIIRYRQPIVELNGVQATDAERLGYACFQADVNPTETNLTRYKNLSASVGVYATAEVLDKPYELALQRGANSIFLLSKEESSYLATLSHEQIFAELPPKINALQDELTQLQTQNSQDLAFYKNYYRITVLLDIYRSLLKRTEFFQEYIKK